MDDKKYWIAMSAIDGIGALAFESLELYFSSIKAAWLAGGNELARAGLGKKQIKNLLGYRNKTNPDEEVIKMESADIRAVTVKEDNYPQILKQIYSPPAVLYYRGKLKDRRDQYMVGVVGTRKFTPYGRQVAEDIAGGLAQAGVGISSGLALGIDAIAHEAAISAGGRTVAVLGSGIDDKSIYPYQNKGLAKKILDNDGLLLSEYPAGTAPTKQRFPQRNRIVSGLSKGILVAEAPEKSGALITARFAIEQNRDVFAVPQNIYNKNAAGPNNLIKMGALAVTKPENILNVLGLEKIEMDSESNKIKADNKEEELLIGILSKEPIHINDIIKKSKLDTQTVNSIIIMMEMKGKVRNLGGMMYITA